MRRLHFLPLVLVFKAEEYDSVMHLEWDSKATLGKFLLFTTVTTISPNKWYAEFGKGLNIDH